MSFALAFRSLRRSPAHAATAFATVFVALAASLAVFALSDALFVRALPVDQPERLVTLSAVVSEPDVADLVARLAPHASLAAYTGTAVALDLGDGPVQVDAEVVTLDYFRVVGAAAPVGRTFGTDAATESRAIVLSHGAWQRRFAGDPAVVGRTVRLNGAPFTLVGVAPRGFYGVASEEAPELWLTLESAPVSMPGWEFQGVRQERFLQLVARLAPGVALSRLGEAAASAKSALAQQFPDLWKEAELAVQPAAATAPALREALAPLFLALRTGSLALLAVACANLALLALARAEARSGESAVRSALGASRKELVGPALAESALIAVAGGAAAVAAAPFLARLLASLLPELRRMALELALDRRLALAAGIGALLVALAASAAPLLAARRRSIAARLASRGTADVAGRSRLRGALVAAEVALAVPLVAGAILFARSLAATGAVDPGFDAGGVLSLRVNAQTVGYDRTRGAQVLEAALDAVRATPGVASAGGAFLLPLGFGDIARPIVASGAPFEPEGPATGYNVVTEGYFDALGIPLAGGRDFAPSDRADAPPVVILSRALASSLWPGTDPSAAVGKRVDLPLRERGASYEVVGVVGDVRNVALEKEPAPLFYLPWRQNYRGRLALVVRGAPGAEGLAPALREAVRRADPALPTYSLQRYDDYLGARLARPRALAALVGVTAGAAALLAAIGVAGVVVVAVHRRRRELGLRLALGSTPARAVATAARSGVAPLMIGGALGVAATAFLAHSIAALVYGVSVTPLVTALPGLAGMLLLGASSALLAARGAARLDPSTLLRAD